MDREELFHDGAHWKFSVDNEFHFKIKVGSSHSEEVLKF